MVSDLYGGQSSVRRLGTSPFQTPNLTCPGLFGQAGVFIYFNAFTHQPLVGGLTGIG